jgi:heat shock protein HslJ
VPPPARRFAERLAIPIILVLVAVALGACSPSAPQLADRVFLSVAVTDGGAARPLVPGTRIRLGFEGSDLSASAGCNAMGGPYRVDAGVLIADALATTDMGCDADRAAQDQWLGILLAGKPTLRLAGDDLTLERGAVVIHLVDRRIAEPDVPLVGPTWTVDSLIDGDATSSVPGGATATLVFHGDGTIDVRPGCNQGGGTWSSVAGGIEISSIGLTKKACEGPAGQLETAVMAVLGAGTLVVDIDSTVLTLRAGGRGLQLRAS